jgi:integrase
MPREFNRLNKRQADKIVKAGKPGWHPDGLGLYLVVAESGSASWTVMYRRKPARRNMGLGPYRLVSLEEARRKRDEAHKLLLEGKDPLAHRAVRRRKQAGAMTFREAAKAYIDATKAERRNPKSLAQWHMTLLGQSPEGERTEFNYCQPLHDLPVGAIDTDAVLSVLKPIWESKPESAGRIRGRIEKVIDYAVVHGRAGEVGPDHRNPAAWKGRLEHLLPSKGKVHEVKHHAALDYEIVPEFMAKLKTREGLAARALELAVLTAVRTGDLIGSDREERPPMKWEHVDLAHGMWTVPKTKTGVEHRVPLVL